MTNTVRIITTDMQFARFIEQIAVHRGVAQLAAMFVHQQLRFCLIIFFDINGFITSCQINCVLATLFRRQRIARAAQKHPCTRSSNHHWAPTLGAGNIGLRGHIRAHARIGVFGHANLFTESFIEGIEQLLPVKLAIGNLIEALFHGSGETIIHQIRKTFGEAVSHDIANLLSENSLVLNADIATILNRRDNRCVGRGSTNTALF